MSTSRTLRLTINATTTTSVLDPPTGFAGVSAVTYKYGSGASTTPSGTKTYTFKSSSLLKGIYSALTSTENLTCATGTTLEYGWYRSSAPTTRFGIGEVVTPPGSNTRVYRADYTPTFSSEYKLLAYCTTGSGASKVYSTALNLGGTSGEVTLTGGPTFAPQRW